MPATNSNRSWTLITLSVFIASPAASGAESPEQGGSLEEIVVTGSLLRRSGYEERSPIVAVDEEAIRSAGYATVQDLARDLTVNAGSELVVETGDLLGVSQFNIRGLGLGSTLTLINGRRAGVAPVADGSGSEFFDTNQLPLSMIQRVDFLTDGASATYGSQAVAGVANIITRKGFEGFEVGANYYDASNEAGSLSFASGIRTERGTFNIYGSYYQQTRNDRTDFDWMLDRIGPASGNSLISTTGQPGSFARANTNLTTGVTTRVNATVPDPNCVGAGGILQGTRCAMEFVDQVSIIPEERHTAVFTEMSYQISERLELYSEAHFAANRVRRTQGPGLFQNGLVSNDRSIFVPASHPFNFFVADATVPAGIRSVDPSVWNPAVDTAVDVACVCRPFGEDYNGEGNAEDRRVDLTYWRALGGFKLGVTKNWSLDAWYQYASGDRDYRTVFNFIADRINAAALDGTWNPFGSAQATPDLVSPKDPGKVAANSQQVLDSLSTHEITETTSRQWTVDAVLSGPVAAVPASTIDAALGAQYRMESFSFTPDPLRAAGEAESPNPVPAAGGEQSVTSVFGETIIPLTANLQLQAAVRYESYEDIGGDTTDPKVALRYEPTDWLALRGSWGTSFQAPSNRQVSVSSSRQLFEDRATLNAQGQLTCGTARTQISGELRVQGRDDLKPQSADNYNVGIILKPLRGMQFRADFWSFSYQDLITQDEGPQAILDNDCADDGIPNDPRVERDPGGNVRVINSFFINAGSVETDGIDFGLDQQLPRFAIGDVALSLQASYIDRFEIKVSDDSPAQDIVGSRNFRNPFRSLPQWRANASVRWSLGPHSVVATVRYIDSYLNDQNDLRIDRFITEDLQYALSLDNVFGGKQTSIRLGVNNLTDRIPPSLGFGVRPGYDETVHDVRGRIFYVSLTHQL
ncbi:MAG: TonB-dependent receptor plug domain-containing protein [Steroidobacteraceae bacterium]